MYKKYKCKLITVKHPTHSPKMVIKTKNKIIMHNEYKILDFFCLEIHRQDCGWTQTMTLEECPPINTLKAAKCQRPQ